jgi:ATP-dependent Clp protease adaptor protein ClpS
VPPEVLMTTETPVRDPDIEQGERIDGVWKVVVWDDPVNTMDYVVYVFRKLFGYDEVKATKLMLQVHNEGRSIVADGPREKAEHDAYRLHHHGLWATIEQ